MIQRDERPTFENFESIKLRLILKLRDYSEKQYIRCSHFIHHNWKQIFKCKLVYILEKVVQDMVLDSYLRQIASGQVTSFWWCYFWNQLTSFPSGFVANFERVFFFSWVRFEKSYITATCCLTEAKLHLKLLLGFSVKPIKTRVNGFQV